MPRITYIDSTGTSRSFEAAEGMSVMQIAIDHKVPGIMGECAGCATCGTCKVAIDAAWAGAPLAPADENERSLLDGEDANVRLGCQIRLTPALDGLVVHVPRSQYR